MVNAYIETVNSRVSFSIVQSESHSVSSEITSYPVEEGINITDHVKLSPISLSIAGQIIGADSESKLNSLLEIWKSRQLCTFAGKGVVRNILIVDFTQDYAVEIANGFNFSMSYIEIKIAHKETILLSNVLFANIDAKLKAQEKEKTETKTSEESDKGKQATADFNLIDEINARNKAKEIEETITVEDGDWQQFQRPLFEYGG